MRSNNASFARIISTVFNLFYLDHLYRNMNTTWMFLFHLFMKKYLLNSNPIRLMEIFNFQGESGVNCNDLHSQNLYIVELYTCSIHIFF